MSDKKTKKQKVAVKIALITFAVITVLMVSLVVINISTTTRKNPTIRSTIQIRFALDENALSSCVI